MALKSGLGRLARELDKAADDAAQKLAERAETVARGNVPIDTGALRTSIETFGAKGSGERIVQAGQSLDYAPFVEYGTSRAAAQPFMTPAAEQVSSEVGKIGAAVVQAAVRKSTV